jgi:hypothetical protein
VNRRDKTGMCLKEAPEILPPDISVSKPISVSAEYFLKKKEDRVIAVLQHEYVDLPEPLS